MLNIFEQDILKWSLYIDFAILNIEIITFKSDPPTTTASSTEATTPEKTNDDSKDNVIAIIIGAVLGTFGLIIIITIIVCVMRRKTNHDNVTNQKHGNTYNRRYQTGNNSGNHEHVSMPNKRLLIMIEGIIIIVMFN